MANPFSKYLSYEDTEHIKVVNFLKDKLPNVLAFHIPSEGMRTAFERYKYSLMGNKKGLLDFTILQPKYKIREIDNQKKQVVLVYHGLIIELKSPEHNYIVKKGKDIGKIKKTKGVLSEEQKQMIEKLNEIKFKAVCCWGADEAIEVIKEYFEL